jgi:hypothetical protein
VYNEQIADLLNPPPKEEEVVFMTPKERMKAEEKLKKMIRDGAVSL